MGSLYANWCYSCTIITPFLNSLFGWRGLWVVVSILVIVLIFILLTLGLSEQIEQKEKSNRMQWFAHARPTIGRSGPWLLFGCFFFMQVSGPQ